MKRAIVALALTGALAGATIASAQPAPAACGATSGGPHTVPLTLSSGVAGPPDDDFGPCSLPDASITAGPSGRVASAAASFRFGGAGSFECSLDGAAWAACASPHAYDGLADGAHTFRVRGDADPTPAARDWTVDTTAPAPVISTPVDGTTISGTAGTAAGDSDTVTVTVYDSGSPVRTFTTAHDGTWSVDVTPPLDAGGYSVRAEQSDAAVPANVGHSAETTFWIVAEPIVVPHPPPPSFLLAPAEARPGARVTVVAACASACTLRVGGRRTSLPGEGTAVVNVRPKARRLRATLTDGGRTLSLNRRVTIRRNAARRLRLWALVSEPCSLSAVSGSGRATVVAGPSPARLDLRLAKPARRLRIEAVALTRTASLTLGR